MKKILLFNPPIYFSNGSPVSIDNSVPPLGLMYLASYLNKNSKKLRAKVVDIGVEKISLEELVKVIKKDKPLVIGISSMTPQLQGAVELAKMIKVKFGNKIKIFLGGPHISADPDFIVRFHDIFDYAITGEGEKTFMESLEKVSEGKKIPQVQKGETIENLDEIPFPKLEPIKREKYNQNESMMFSRGCPYHCYYCSRPSISRLIRYRSANNLIKEIIEKYPFCQGKIDFQDDTFTLNRNKVIEFCQAVSQKGLKLSWRCNSRIDLVDDELLGFMKKAGCSLIHFGIEAGNEIIRKEKVNKGLFTNKDITRIIALCHKHGIKFAGYFMIGHPGETKKNLEETKKMILTSGIDIMGLSIPTPFPGSILYDVAKSRGIVNEQIIDQFAMKKLGEGYVGNYPVLTSEKVSRDYIFSLMKEINRNFYLTPKMFLRKLFEDIFSFNKLKQDFFDLTSLVMRGISSRKPYVKSSLSDKIS